MSASISTKKKNLGSEFLRATARHIAGATGDYISDVMPNTSSIVSESKSTLQQAGATLSNTAQSVIPKMRQMNMQRVFRQISGWYMDKEDEFDGGFDENLDFDIDGDDVDPGTQAEISEFAKGANEISKAVVESSHKSVEATIAATANIVTSLDKQSAIVAAGFDRTNETLNKILEVLTKNTATLIEVGAAQASSTSAEDAMKTSGKFSLSNYKKMVSKNLQQGEFGMIASMLPMLTNPDMIKEMLSPQTLMKMGLGMAIDKKSPNFKKNMKALDDAINETIMTSLIRLGEQGGFGMKGMLARAFGIRSDRQDASTARQSLEVKAVPYDTISKDYLTNAIPGYLRQMVLLMGGPDMVYDARSRSFKTKAAIKNEFHDMVATTGTLRSASKSFQNNIQNTTFNNMMFDLMMNDLGKNAGVGGGARKQISSMRDDPKAALAYAMQLVGSNASASDKKMAEEFARQMVQALNSSGVAGTQLGNQVARQNAVRNQRSAQIVDTARLYNVDLSHVRDSAEEDEATIRRMYGRGKGGRQWTKEDRKAIADISRGGSFTEQISSGTDYTNIALYEIWRRLNEGINVFRVGKDDKQEKPYDKFGDDVLMRPKHHRPKKITSKVSGTSIGALGVIRKTDGGPNLLRNNETTDSDGNVIQEDLTKGQRFARWGKERGGYLAKAMFSGSPEEVRDAFGAIMGDVAQVGGDAMKSGLSKINESFGNVSGYLKHKMFGTEYTYMDGDKEVRVKKNEEGGIFGFISQEVKDMFGNARQKAGEWLKTTMGYFNFGDSDDEEQGVASKRKKLLAASVGAFAGAGILGGPIGLLAGSLAGSALTSLGFGDKIKNFLFGHDDDGKPTGIIAKAADAVISPIKFQLGKTISFAGATLQKHVFGPLSDIGLALKDRITNHVDTVFDKIKEAALAPFKGLAKLMGKGILAIGEGLMKVGNAVSNTLPGKLIRGAIGAGGAIIGGAQNSIAKSIAGGGSYHKLRRGETYTIKLGQMYYDPATKERHIATRDIAVDGDDKDAPQPRTKDYLKQRRKARNKDIDQSLEDSGYYDSGRGILGRVGGFFGGDYRKWHEKELERQKNRRKRLKSATAEIHMTPEEIIAEEEEKTRKQQEELAAKQEKHNEKSEAELGKITGEIIPGSSFKVHDQGIHDRLDHIIEFLTGAKFQTTEKKPDDAPSTPSLASQTQSTTLESDGGATAKVGISPLRGNAVEEDDAFANSVVAGAMTLASGGEGSVDGEEYRIGGNILDEANKSHPSKNKLSRDLKEMMSIQKGAKEAAEEKKETFWDKLMKILGGDGGILSTLIQWGAALAGLAGLINLLGGGDVINNIVNNFADAAKTFAGAGDSDDPVTTGINTATNLVDVKVKNKTDLFNPFAPLFHNRDAGDGTSVVHQDATRAKNNWLLWTPLRQSITQPFAFDWAASRAMSKSNAAMGTAVDLTQQAAMARMDGNTDLYNSLIDQRDAAATKSGEYAEKSQGYSDKAGDLRANAGMNVVKNIETTAARVGVMDVLSRGVGGIANWGAQRLGADEESAARIGNYATAGTTAALMLNQAKSTLTGKTSIVDKILGILKKLFDFLAGKFKAVKALQNFGGKIEQFFANIYNKSVGKVTEKIAAKIEAALAARFGEDSAKQLVSALGVGIPIALGAISGIASGLCGVEHLFQVSPGDADATMKTVSAIETGVFEALEWTPGIGFIVAALDIIDSTIIEGIFGKPLRQYIAEFIYNLIKGDGGASLAEKQGAFIQQRDTYNEKYGTNLNTQTFNDLVNNGGWVDKIWRGGMKYDEEGNLKFDEAGGRIDGGIKGWVVGGEKTYVHDENGNVLRSADGSAIVARDAKGNVIKAEEKWGDKVGQFFNGAGKWLFGGDIYETDENGVAKVDENGNYIVKEHQANVLSRAGTGISNWWNGQEITNPDGSVTKTEGFKDAAARTLGNIGATIAQPFKDAGTAISNWWGGTTELDADGNPILDENGKPIKKGGFKDAALTTLGNIGSAIATPFKNAGSAISTWWSGENELDENGQPILDENGKPIKKGGFKDWALTGLGKVASTTGNFFRGIGAIATDWIAGEYERDEDGNPLLDENGKPIRKGGLAGWIKGGLGKLNEAFVEPAKEMISSAKDWVKDKAEWVKDGLSSAGSWIAGKASDMWTAISTPVKDFVGGAKSWLHDTGDWLKEGAASAGAWLSEKASSAWSAISTPVKDFASSAKDWMESSGEWLSEKVSSAGEWISEKAASAWTAISTPVKDFVSGATEWVSEKADWVKDKAKDAKDWITTNVSNVFSSITENVKDLAGGAKDWVKEKAEWVKDGAKSAADWVADKASSVWDWITGGIKAISEKGEQAAKDAEYINGKGGPKDPMEVYMNDGGGGTTAVVQKSGGNPLNKDFRISSKYGWRTLDKGSEFHSGVDLVPTDGSGSAQVGSRFNGTVIAADDSVSDSMTGLNVSTSATNGGAGNFIKIKTDEGYTIKNFHLKHGSIPSALKTPGARVKIGDKVGEMGSTGRSTGPHLHYQMEADNVTDAKGNHTFDPTTSISGGTTMSSFNGTSDGLFSTSGEFSASSGLGIISQLQNIGNEAMRMIFGDLLDVTGSSSSSSGSTISGTYAGLSGTPITNADVPSLWAYFKSMGYSDTVISGILGCWQAESGINAKRVEWDTSNAFKNTVGSYDAVATNRTAVDSFTQQLFNQYAKQGKSISRKAYYETGVEGSGHLYPGLGLAQWTGGRGKSLIEFAKSNGRNWYDHDLQLAYMDNEMKNNSYYNNGLKQINTATTPEEAARLFCKWYEGYSGDLGARPTTARNFYNQYAGKVSATSGMGGPPQISSINFLSPSERKKLLDSNAVGGPYSDPSNPFDLSPAVPDGRPASEIRRIATKPIIQKNLKPKKANQDAFLSALMGPAPTTSRSGSSGAPGGVGGPAPTDTSEIVSLLKSAIIYLEGINKNTGSSSDLLSSLNEKDFSAGDQDQGSGGSRSRSGSSAHPRSSNRGNTRMITNMARP